MQHSVLIVLHGEHSTPGRIGNALRDLGYRLDVRKPRFDDPLPHSMAEHSAGIIFGGPMSANDRDDFIRREIGYYPIRPTAAGSALVEQWPERVYQWHREGFDLPGGSELLAEGDTFEVQ